MNNIKQPLAEVFGFPITDQSAEAKRYRKYRLCPFKNDVPNCTKDTATNPLGICSIYHENKVAITCPIRFRQDWIIVDNAAEFFFPAGTKWSSLANIELDKPTGRSIENADFVLVAHDDKGDIYDFGVLCVQAAYTKGDLRALFEFYMSNSIANQFTDCPNQFCYPRPDYLSSSQKQLVPDLLFKGGLFNSWKKKIAIALHKSFFETLPPFKRVKKETAEIAWMIYDLKSNSGKLQLQKIDVVYTEFQPTLKAITQPASITQRDFMNDLQEKFEAQ